MHVLHAVQLYRPVPSGAARYFVEVGERLAQEGHRVTVVATDAFDLEHLWLAGRRHIEELEDYHNGVRVQRFAVRRLPGPALTYPVLRRLMVELGRFLPGRLAVPLLSRLAQITPQLVGFEGYLRRAPELADVDLLHSTNITLDFMLLPLQRWAKRRGIPHVCTPFVHLGEPEHNQVRRYYSMPHQLDLLKQCAYVITQTELERRFLTDRGIPARQMQTIGVGVTPQEIAGGNGAHFRRQHQIDGPLVLTIGTAAYDKGTLHVVEALQKLWAAGLQVTWVQIGPLMDHFERFQQALPAADQARMRVLGFVDNQVRLDALAAADLFVLPSRTDSFGIVYLEAWCYELPVIGAWAGGVPEVIQHGETGLLVPFGAVPALAQAMERLLTDRQLARAFGRLGRARVLRELTWEHKYVLVRRTYGEALRSAAHH